MTLLKKKKKKKRDSHCPYLLFSETTAFFRTTLNVRGFRLSKVERNAALGGPGPSRKQIRSGRAEQRVTQRLKKLPVAKLLSSPFTRAKH